MSKDYNVWHYCENEKFIRKTGFAEAVHPGYRFQRRQEFLNNRLVVTDIPSKAMKPWNHECQQMCTMHSVFKSFVRFNTYFRVAVATETWFKWQRSWSESDSCPVRISTGTPTVPGFSHESPQSLQKCRESALN